MYQGYQEGERYYESCCVTLVVCMYTTLSTLRALRSTLNARHLERASRYRHPQLQVTVNYLNLHGISSPNITSMTRFYTFKNRSSQALLKHSITPALPQLLVWTELNECNWMNAAQFMSNWSGRIVTGFSTQACDILWYPIRRVLTSILCDPALSHHISFFVRAVCHVTRMMHSL